MTRRAVRNHDVSSIEKILIDTHFVSNAYVALSVDGHSESKRSCQPTCEHLDEQNSYYSGTKKKLFSNPRLGFSTPLTAGRFSIAW